MKINEIIDNLNLISGVIPDYAEGRNRGLSDDECEKVAYEAISEAIEVLEKQISKEVKVETISHGDISEDVIICPNCNELVDLNGERCFSCDQKLKWENVKFDF